MGPRPQLSAAQVGQAPGADAPSPRPALTIVIVTWNSASCIEACLGSIPKTLTGSPVEIIIVDNASADACATLVKKRYPDATIIENERNVGFPRANNLGIRRARGSYILLLNPDTVVQPKTLDKCLAAMEADGGIGLLGCRILYPDGALQHECACHLPELRDVLIETLYLHMLFPASRVFGRHRMSYWDHLEDRVVPCISGAFMLMRRAALEQVGLLDERFFMYYEDFELCARMARKRWRIQYLCEPTITHLSGQSRSQSVIEFDYTLPVLRYTYFREYRGLGVAVLYRVLCLGQAVARTGIAVAGRCVLFWNAKALNRAAFRPRVHWERALWAVGLRTFEEAVSPNEAKTEATRAV